MTPLEITANTILDKASSTPFGIEVEVEDFGESIQPTLRAKAILYRVRKELGDPRYAELQIALSPDAPDKRLWVINMPGNEGETP